MYSGESGLAPMDDSRIGRLADPRKRWQQQGEQDGDDPNDHHQFDEGECAE
jgi:hypothetical protein